jgi:hypothetical protein
MPTQQTAKHKMDSTYSVFGAFTELMGIHDKSLVIKTSKQNMQEKNQILMILSV